MPLNEYFDEDDPIRSLIEYAAARGFGVTFEPYRGQWNIGYIRGNGGGELTTAVELDDGCAAAFAPLEELAEKIEQQRKLREQK